MLLAARPDITQRTYMLSINCKLHYTAEIGALLSKGFCAHIIPSRLALPNLMRRQTNVLMINWKITNSVFTIATGEYNRSCYCVRNKIV